MTMIPTTRLRQKRHCSWGKRAGLDGDLEIMVPTDQDQDRDHFPENQGMMELEDNLDMLDKEGMVIVIDHSQTQELLCNHHKHSLGVSDADVEHTTRLELTVRR